MRCNTFTKFRDLLRKADAIDARWIATGHYARMIDGALHRGLDPAKDQSYFLWGIDRAVLSRMLLPVGAQTKAETRAVAHELGLELIAEKRGEPGHLLRARRRPHADHRARPRRRCAGAVARARSCCATARCVGEHDGFARFTVGQRRGLPGGFAEPMFVVAIEPATRAVVIGPREELLGRGVVAREVNWLVAAAGARRGGGGADPASARARRAACWCASMATRWSSRSTSRSSAISPGQSMVLYDGDRVLGGGVIERGRRALPVRAA